MRQIYRAFIAGAAILNGSVAMAAGPSAVYEEPVVAMPPSDVADWSGPFFGARIGLSKGATDFRYLDAGTNADHDTDGYIAGLYGGFDVQSGANVFGIDLSYAFADITGSTACPGAGFTCMSALEDLGAIRGRFGRVVNNSLVYVAAGYAAARATADADLGAGGVFPDNSARIHGWTAALGMQRMVRNGWSIRGEISHYDFGATAAGEIVADGGGNPFELDMDATVLSVGIEKRW